MTHLEELEAKSNYPKREFVISLSTGNLDVPDGVRIIESRCFSVPADIDSNHFVTEFGIAQMQLEDRLFREKITTPHRKV